MHSKIIFCVNSEIDYEVNMSLGSEILFVFRIIKIDLKIQLVMFIFNLITRLLYFKCYSIYSEKHELVGEPPHLKLPP